MGWFEDRFIESKNGIKHNCLVCSCQMWFPASKAGKYKTCGTECSKKLAEIEKQKRKRNCLTCGNVFYPRKTQLNSGYGKFCSQKCNTAKKKFSHTAEANLKRIIAYMLTMEKRGFPRGENHPKWKGGQKATVRRRIESGKAAESVRKYRTKNPEKVKEFNLRRKSKKFGRLPNGFIKNLMFLQKNMCAICKTEIKQQFHVDHIYPIAKGGKHEPQNIQLLCKTCNLRKSAKDPIDYMQSIGFLL